MGRTLGNIIRQNWRGCTRFYDGFWYSYHIAYENQNIEESIGMFEDIREAMNCVDTAIEEDLSP